MSKTIDEKVVSMRFDNSNFESNVKNTLSTLDKLKHSLNLKGASKGLSDVGAAANKINLSGFGNAVETIKIKFSSLHVMASTVIEDLTRKAENLASRIVNMFAVEPISTGFNEYELKMDSVQTILASSGASLETVNQYLADLNEYSDKTIYSFSDMTASIGKFTNAGVSLDQAVLAIKGISNEAALSGANANEASRAMYNFSQALSTGSVKLIDWKSIENANMATVEFKEQLIASAVACGTLTDNLDGTYTTMEGNVLNATLGFNDSLQDQWMTTDVLVKTLGQYADETTDIGARATEAATKVNTFSKMVDTLKESAQSGWAQSWEIIFGDFNEGTNLWTSLTDKFGGVIQKMSDIRNNFLERALGERSGAAWEQISTQVSEAGISVDDFKAKLIEVGIQHGAVTQEMIDEAGSFEESLKSGWASPEIVAEAIGSYTDNAAQFKQSTQDMTDKLNYFQDVVTRVWQGEFYNGEQRIQALSDAGYDYAKVQELVNKTVDGHRLTLEDLGEEQMREIGFTEEQIASLNALKAQAAETGTSFNDLINDMGKMSGRQMLFEGFKNILEQIGKIFGAIMDAFKDGSEEFNFGDLVYDLITKFYEWTETLTVTDSTLQHITDTVTVFKNTIKTIKAFTSPVFTSLTKIVGVLQKALGLDFWSLMNRAAELSNQFLTWWTGNSNDVLTPLIDAGNKVLDLFNSVFTSVRTAFAGFLDSIGFKDKVNGIGTALVDGFKGVFDLFTSSDFISVFTTFTDKLNSIENMNFESLSQAFMEFGSSLWAQLKQIPGKFQGVWDIIMGIVDSINAFFGNTSDNVSKFWTDLQGIWGKIYGFFKKIKDNLVENFGFAEVAVVAAGVVITSAIFGIIKILDKLGTAIVSWSSVLKSFGGVADGLKGMFEEIGKAAKLAAVSMIIRSVAIGLLALAAAFFVFAQLDWGQIAKGGVAIVILVGALAGLTFVMTKLDKIKIKENPLTGAALVLAGVVIALLGIIGALKLMESLNPDLLLQNGLILVGGVAILIGAIIALAKFTTNSELGTTAAIMATLSGFLLSLAGAMNILKDIPSDVIMSSGLSVAMVLGVLVGIMAVVKRVGIYAMGAGASILAISVSIFLLMGAMKLVADMDGIEYLKNFGKIMGFLAAFTAVMLATKLVGEHANKAGVFFLGIGAAILSMAACIRLLKDLKPEEFNNGVLAIMGFTAVLVLLMAATQLVGGKELQKSAIMFLGVSAVLMAMTAVVVVLGHLKPDQMQRGLGAIMVMGIVILALLAVTHVSRFNANSAKSITAMAVVIGAIAAAIAILSFIDFGAGIAAASELSLVLIAFGAAMKLVGNVRKMSVKAIGAIGAMIAVLVLTAGAIYILQSVGWASALSSAFALSMVMVALAVVLNLVSNVGKGAAVGVLGIIGLSVAVGVLAFSLRQLADVPIDNIKQAAFSLAMLLAVVAAATYIISGLGPVALIFAGVVLALGAAILLGAWGFDMFSTALEKCVGVLPGVGEGLNLVGAGIAAFINHIASCSGSVGDFANVIVTVGGSISSAMKDIAVGLIALGVGALIGGVGLGVLGTSIMIVSGGLLMLCAVVALGVLMIGSAINAISNDAAEAGGNLTQGFSNGIMSGLGSVIAAGASLCSTIKNTICGLLGIHSPSTEGQTWGENTGQGYAQGLENSAPDAAGAATSFIDTVKGVFTNSNLNETANSSAKEAASNVGSGMIDGISSIGQSVGSSASSVMEGAGAEAAEGLNAGFEENADPFASLESMGYDTSQLKSMMQSAGVDGADSLMAGFEGSFDPSSLMSMDGFDSSQIQAQMESMGVDCSDGFMNAFSGNFNMSEAVSGEEVDTSKITADMQTAGSEAATAFNQGFSEGLNTTSLNDSIVKALEAVNSKSSDFETAGTQLMADFATGIQTGGDTVKQNISDLITGINDSFSNATEPLTKFGTALDGIATRSGILQTIATDIGNIGTNALTASTAFESMDSAVSTVVSNISNIGMTVSSSMGSIPIIVATASSSFYNLSFAATSGAQGVIAACASMASATTTFASIGSSMVAAFASAISGSAGLAVVAVAFMLLMTVSTANSYASSFTSAGSRLGLALVNGFKSKASGMSSAAASACSAAASTASGYYSSFKSSGEWCGQGLADGLDAKYSSVAIAAQKIINKAKEAADAAAGISSPSKVFKQIGIYLGEGLVLGIEAMENSVGNASRDMAMSAVDNASSTLDALEKLDLNADIQTTISPVLDMDSIDTTNLQIGANVDAYLSGPIESMTRLMTDAQVQINNSNAQVIDAVNALRDDLNTIFSGNDTEIALYVDSKKLTSTLVKPMNRQLNILANKGGF